SRKIVSSAAAATENNITERSHACLLTWSPSWVDHHTMIRTARQVYHFAQCICDRSGPAAYSLSAWNRLIFQHPCRSRNRKRLFCARIPFANPTCWSRSSLGLKARCVEWPALQRNRDGASVELSNRSLTSRW